MNRKKRLHIFVAGVVQGVFFRAHTRNTALNLDLVGWVQNLSDGRVEIVAEGETGRLRELLEWCHKGPRPARVDNVEVTWDQATGEFETFEVKY